MTVGAALLYSARQTAEKQQTERESEDREHDEAHDAAHVGLVHHIARLQFVLINCNTTISLQKCIRDSEDSCPLEHDGRRCSSSASATAQTGDIDDVGPLQHRNQLVQRNYRCSWAPPSTDESGRSFVNPPWAAEGGLKYLHKFGVRYANL